MRDALAMRIFLALTRCCMVALAADTLADLDRICNDPEVSCRWRDVHRHVEGRTLSAPVIITTTTTTTNFKSFDINALVQFDIYADPHNLDNILDDPRMITFCMVNNISSAESRLREMVVFEFFRQLYLQKAQIQVEVASGRKSVIASVMYVNMEKTTRETNKVITFAVSRLAVNCVWVGEFSTSASLDWNFMMARLANQNSGIMLAPLNMGLASSSANVFSLAPDRKYFLDTALHTVRRTGYVDTVAYIYLDFDNDVEASAEKEKCSRIDELAESMGYTVVLGKGVASEEELLSVTSSLQTFAPDVVVLCLTEHALTLDSFINRLEHLEIEPKAVIIGDYVLSLFGERLGNKADFVTGVDLWANTLETTSDLIFTNMSNADLVTILDSLSASGESRIGSRKVAASETKYVMLWICLELGLWAIKSGKMPTEVISLSVARENLSKLTTERPISSFAGAIAFDESGQRDNSAYMCLQWQPALNSSSGKDNHVLQVVAPTEYATRWLWFPKPTWIEMKCFFSLSQQGLQSHGFAAVDSHGHLKDCRRCDPGHAVVHVQALVSQLEIYGDLHVLICEVCPVGKYSRLRIYSNGWEDQKCIFCAAGRYADREGMSTCNLCPPGKYGDTEGMSTCLLCAVGRFAQSTGETRCKECQHPRMAAREGSHDCVRCPVGADCPRTENGYSTYISKEGFYRLGVEDGLNDEVWSLKKEQYPLGMVYVCPYAGTVCLSNNTCSDLSGMHGPMCGTCKPGYEKGGSYKPCQECPSTAGRIILLLCDQAFVIGIALLIYFECVASKSHHDHQIMIVLKQFLAYIWLMNEFNPFLRFHFGGDQSNMNNQLELWRYLNYGKVAYHCVLHHTVPDEPVVYSMIVAAFLAIPFCLVQLLPAVILKYPILKCVRIKQKVPVSETLVAVFIILVYLTHRSCTSAFLEVFRCLLHDETRLVIQSTIRCQSDEHHYWQFIALIGIVIISFGLPVIFALVMRTHRHLWNDGGMRKYGFLHLGFKHEYWYWESVLMMRNVMFAAVPLQQFFRGWAFDEHSRYDASRVGLLFVSVAFYVLHKVMQPWDDRSFMYLEVLETAMLQAFMVMFALQVSMQSIFDEAIPQRQFDVTTSFVTVTTCVFHLRFLYYVMRGVIGPLTKKRICACCTRSHKFSRKNLVLRTTGIELHSSREHDVKLVAGVFARVARVHLQSCSVFDIKEFVKSMQNIFIMASYFKRLEKELGRSAATVYDAHLTVLGGEKPSSHAVTEFTRSVSSISKALSTSASHAETTISKAITFATTFVSDEYDYEADEDMEGPKALIEHAQTNAALYDGERLSVSAVFRSYLRERSRLANKVKAEEAESLKKIRDKARAEENEFYDEDETIKEAKRAIADAEFEVFMHDVGKAMVVVDKQDKDKNDTNVLPNYRVLLSHVRALQTELHLADQENERLKTAMQKCNVPPPLALAEDAGHGQGKADALVPADISKAEGPSLQEEAVAEEALLGTGPMSRQQSPQRQSADSMSESQSLPAESADGSAMSRLQTGSAASADDGRDALETLPENDEQGIGQEETELDREESENIKREEQRLTDEIAMLRSEIEREKRLASERQEELNQSMLAQAAAVALAAQEKPSSSTSLQQREGGEPRGPEQATGQESRRSSKASITPQQHEGGEPRGPEQATGQESRRSSKASITPQQLEGGEPQGWEETAGQGSRRPSKSSITPQQPKEVKPGVSEQTAAKLVSAQNEIAELEGKHHIVNMQCEALTRQIDLMHELLTRQAKAGSAKRKSEQLKQLQEEKDALGVDDEDDHHPLIEEIHELQKKIANLQADEDKAWRGQGLHAEEDRKKKEADEQKARLAIPVKAGPVKHKRLPPFLV